MTDPETKVKDPKKVAAGRAGAAACKAKQEKLLKELQEAKESILSRGESGFKSQEEPGPVANVPQEKHTWIPWILGAAGLVGVVIFQRNRQQPVVHKTSSSDVPPVVLQPP